MSLRAASQRPSAGTNRRARYASDEHIDYIDDQEPTARLRTVLAPQAIRVRDAATLGDSAAALAALDEHRLLCARREGPRGVRHWNRQVEHWLTETPVSRCGRPGTPAVQCW